MKIIESEEFTKFAEARIANSKQIVDLEEQLDTDISLIKQRVDINSKIINDIDDIFTKYIEEVKIHIYKLGFSDAKSL